MNGNNYHLTEGNSLVEKINLIKQNAEKRRHPYGEEQLKHPINFWVKNDRLLNGIGKELTIILRTRGCSWALSENGGCSMCGYYLDANRENVSVSQIINQFDYALNNKIEGINQDSDDFVLKIFNSGSFLDENEIPERARTYIYEKISKLNKFKEVVIESRVEYITMQKLEELKDFLTNKYLEIAIGLETVNDYIRYNYINKGISFKDFKDALDMCKTYDIGVKVYLMFKPLFLNEQAAIDDCSFSIKVLKDLGVNSISINPMNIQKGTLVEYLWYQNRYRPPWWYSLFKCIKKSVNQDDLKKIRLLSDPSGGGKSRGIHNCLKSECENSAKSVLKNFNLSQNLNELDKQKDFCECKKKYQLQKNYY
ncbi:MAG: archaeosine biosynthesis radical SAM protein RaSEA [Promethearchaeota archaeon]